MNASQKPLVTVAIPIFKRLHFLPDALHSVAEQDYPEIELLVSDNGENGPELRELVREHYPHPVSFRRNDVTEPVMSRHFNQLVESAKGKYFVLLCDDDKIGPRFVSSLVEALEGNPEVGVALPLVELMSEDGKVMSAEEIAQLPYSTLQTKRLPPRSFSGRDFVRMWVSGEYRFENFATMMARTEEVKKVGGYPEMPTGDDDAVALKLSLGRLVAFCPEAVFLFRAYEASCGLAISPWVLAADIKRWLEFVDSDPVLMDFASQRPAEWREVRGLMIEKAWRTYRHRWRTMYQKRMGRLAWLRAGFALPFIPAYYRWLFGYLVKRGLSIPKRLVRA